MNQSLLQISMDGYDYPLSTDQIAFHPLPQRDASRLLVYRNGLIEDRRFSAIPHFLPPGSSLVFNDTRVIEARLFFQKESGGVIEIFCLQPHELTIEDALATKGRARWQCLVGGASKWKHGLVLQKSIVVDGGSCTLHAAYIDKKEGYFVIEFWWEPSAISFGSVIHAAGRIPLPPYIKREADAEDTERYQTVFASHEGSVAAPTAALHFTPAVFQSLAAQQVHSHFLTLHVGAGTFKPVKSETIGGHQMHREPFTVTRSLLESLIKSETVVAVGTTSLRSLESLYWLGVKRIKNGAPADWHLGQWEVYELEEMAKGISYPESFSALSDWMDENAAELLHCATSLIIVPGYKFRVPKALVTNFHQPQSTLLLLVSAFIGEDWRRVYSHALENGYRFLSYGDSSLLWRKDSD